MATILVPQRPDKQLSLDFVSDQFTDGRRLRILAIVDDCTRKCLALVGQTSLSGCGSAQNWTGSLPRGTGRPMVVVSDNGKRVQLERHPGLGRSDPRRVASSDIPTQKACFASVIDRITGYSIRISGKHRTLYRQRKCA